MGREVYPGLRNRWVVTAVGKGSRRALRTGRSPSPADSERQASSGIGWREHEWAKEGKEMWQLSQSLSGG